MKSKLLKVTFEVWLRLSIVLKMLYSILVIICLIQWYTRKEVCLCMGLFTSQFFVVEIFFYTLIFSADLGQPSLPPLCYKREAIHAHPLFRPVGTTPRSTANHLAIQEGKYEDNTRYVCNDQKYSGAGCNRLRPVGATGPWYCTTWSTSMFT